MPPEENLDPEDWESIRSLGHRIVDDMIDYSKNIRELPAWRHAPDEVKSHFKKPLPLNPEDPEQIYQEFLENILPYPIGNLHPRFWGWVFGTGTVLGAFSEFLAATMNTNSGDLDNHSAIHVETQVTNWLKELMGFPASASGLLTSGCSAANLIGLAVARNSKAGINIRQDGLQGISSTSSRKGEKSRVLSPPSRPMVLYASQEIHSSVQKAVELLGLGSNSLRRIQVNQSYQIDIEALSNAVEKDRRAGYLPFCVVGAVGTTNTGAIDDLQALADLCQHENLWFHIDGAFGAWAILSPTARHLVNGMERADSLAFDLHKWMYMPYEIGCVLVKDAAEHRNTFSLTPAYLARIQTGRGLTGGDLPWFSDCTFELSKSFRSLKAWMSFKEHGIHKYGRLIEQNIQQARYLAQLIESTPEIELAAPVTLNVLCFRYINIGLDDSTLDTINQEIIVELQERGIAVLSGTTLKGKYVLRVGHTNHRTRKEDFDILVKEIVKIGDELSSIT